jgi:polysaccharide export outer membrane protein
MTGHATRSSARDTSGTPLGSDRRARASAAALAGIVWAAALGCATTPMPPPTAPTRAAYLVGAPDRLHVTIYPDPVIERDVTVRPDGMISIDLIGDVPAGGRSLGQITTDVEQRIGRFKRGATVTLSLLAAHSNAVTVLGEVRAPQSFELQKDTRVAEAIGQVGGAVYTGSTDSVRVVRSGGGEAVVYHVDLDAIQAGDLRTNILLASGDIVYVPPTFWARFGYAVQAVLFPFNPLLGLGTSVAGTVIGQ